MHSHVLQNVQSALCGFTVADGNYTKIGFYNATSDNLTWVDNERWLGKLKI